jgi:hypothetical protein
MKQEHLPKLVTESALHDESSTESPRSAAVRELLRLLVKAQKAQRLYEGKNAVSQRLGTELFDRLTGFLDAQGDIQLVVQEFQLISDDDVVYNSEDRNDSLAFLLYRDGVRRLTFHAGLEPQELAAFLDCLNRVALLTNDQDDLVTLFWAQEFHAIRYFAIEALSTADNYPRLEEQLASGEAGTGEGGASAERVTLDLQQPVSTIPVEACRLTDEEIEALREELASEERIPYQHLVTELAIELTLLEGEPEEQDEIRSQLVAIAKRLIADGELVELVGMQEHLDGLASMVFPDNESVQRLASEVMRALGEPASIEGFLDKVEQIHRPKPDLVTAYLARFAPAVSPTLLPWMGRFTSPAYRRAVTNALLATPDGGLGALEANLPIPTPEPGSPEELHHRQFVREMLHAIAQHPGDEALPLLERLVDSADGFTGRESFVALSRYPEPRVDELCLSRLGDRDREIRTTALDTLVRRGKPELGSALLERSMRAEHFDAWNLSDKRRLFAAAAKLSGEMVLDPFRQLLLGREDGWFASRKEKELAEAVVHGIHVIGTDRARRLLEECARSNHRIVRTACQKQLSTTRS